MSSLRTGYCQRSALNPTLLFLRYRHKSTVDSLRRGRNYRIDDDHRRDDEDHSQTAGSRYRRSDHAGTDEWCRPGGNLAA